MTFPFPFVHKVGTAGFAGWTFSQSAATTTSGTITLPTAISTGDLIVIQVISTLGPGAPSAVTPAGYTLLGNITTGIYRMEAYCKRSAGSDSSASVSTMSGGGQYIVAIFSGGAASITPTTWGAQATASAPTNQTVNGGTAPTIYFGLYGVSTTAPTRGFSTTADAEFTETTGAKIYLKYKIYNTTPASTTISQTDGGDNYMMSGWINGA